ncbi:hypothetical protein QE152_g32664 [Popillia japonica]|uniref:Uncharacterized protein n=1 Tax=Popillia japonica TaxID=7064 RepID=A0AAW1IY82_POPJA
MLCRNLISNIDVINFLFILPDAIAAYQRWMQLLHIKGATSIKPTALLPVSPHSSSIRDHKGKQMTPSHPTLLAKSDNAFVHITTKESK